MAYFCLTSLLFMFHHAFQFCIFVLGRNLHCQLIGYQRTIRKPQTQQPTPLSTAIPELLQQVPPSIAHPVSAPMATSSSPTSSSSSENDGDVPGKVKVEENGEGLKRTLSHKQGSSKRQRTEADPLAPAEQVGLSFALCPERMQGHLLWSSHQESVHCSSCFRASSATGVQKVTSFLPIIRLP